MWNKALQVTASLVVLTFLCASVASAQEKTVTGTVTDAQSGETLPGANVTVQGTQTGTTTNAQGEYKIEVPGPDATLVFSFIGYQSEEVEVGDQTVIDVTLQENVGQLDEVVVTGYGTQRRAEITGSVSSVDVESANVGQNSSPQDLIQGRVAGVNVVQNSGEPGAGMRIRVRGQKSISASNDPLYVIDGVPISSANVTPGGASAGGAGGSNESNPLSTINPQDIESIQILKDAAATAIYGSQGSNGVVLIETKSGSTSLQVDYSGKISRSSTLNELNLLSGEEYRQAVAEFQDTPVEDQPNADTDWQDRSLRSTTFHEHNLSLSGGNESSQYRASLNYSDQQGLFANSGLERTSARVNASHSTFDDRLRFNLNLTGSLLNRNHTFYNQAGGFQGGIMKGMIGFDPRRPVREEGEFFEYSRNIRNPVALLQQVTDITDQKRILANLSAEVDILDNLTAKGTFGSDVQDGIRRSYVPKSSSVGSEVGGIAVQSERNISNLVAQTTLRYNQGLFGGAHNFRLLGGFEYKQETFQELGIESQNFITDATLYNRLQSGKNPQTPFSGKARVNQVSFFGRANYNIQEKYLFEATLRRDGSSVFGSANKFAYFPSASIGWNIAEESFLNVEGLTQLKLRVSGGISGNQAVPPLQSKALLEPDQSFTGIYGTGENEVVGVAQSRAASPELKWEETREVNVGVDFTAGRFDGSVEYYRSRTDDLLLDVRVLPPAPSSFVLDNVGAVSNEGVEATLDALVLDTENMSLNIGANASTNKNLVEDLGGRGTIDHGAVSGAGQSGVDAQRLEPGHPIGSFYAPVFVRINDQGNEVYETEDGGTTTTLGEARRAHVGNPIPDVSYGVNARFQYQNFDVSAFVRGEQGREIFNNTALEFTTKSNLGQQINVLETALEDGTNAGHVPVYSSRWIQDASFLRLSKLTLGYNFPNVSEINMRRARVYVSAQNLFVLTPYDGYDPEVNTNVSGEGLGFRGLSTPSRGIDYTSYPTSRTFTLGVEIGL